MKIIKFGGLFLLLLCFIFVLSLNSCRHAFLDESEIESELLELTPIGSDGQSAILNLDKTYGTDSFLFKGPARFEKNEWKTLGINDGMDIGSRKAPFFFSYKLGSHMSEYIILPTVVSATWIFDEEGKLAEIRVIKTVDGL